MNAIGRRTCGGRFVSALRSSPRGAVRSRARGDARSNSDYDVAVFLHLADVAASAAADALAEKQLCE